MSEIDPGIEAYRQELVAEAELARADLDEIEDHLRSLASSLHADGMTAAAAVREAARRLGDPRAIAREHARVRSPFGARISRARAWSVALLLAPFVCSTAVDTYYNGVMSGHGLELALATGLLVALVARLPWARATVLGMLLSGAVFDAIALATLPVDTYTAARFACYAGAIAFLAPWRRGELSASGLGLALLGPAYAAAAPLVLPYGGHLVAGSLAMIGVLGTGLGGLLRARWAAVPAALGSIALVAAALDVVSSHVIGAAPGVWHVAIVGSLLAGAAGIVASGMLFRRGARSALGTVREIIR